MSTNNNSFEIHIIIRNFQSLCNLPNYKKLINGKIRFKILGHNIPNVKALSFVAEWLLLEKSRIYQLCGLGKRTLFCAQNSSF